MLRDRRAIKDEADRDCISVSIVTYHPDRDLLARTAASLAKALEQLSARGVLSGRAKLVFINNGGEDPRHLVPEFSKRVEMQSISASRNLGYGAAHNLALEQVESTYHLVLNPDVEMHDDALASGIAWMRQHPDVVAIAPEVLEPGGGRSYLCRRRPRVRSLFLRAFTPQRIRARFARLQDDYEMHDLVDGERVVWDPPLISGCFMLFNTNALRGLGGFDPRYFLYFEDYDLSLRAAGLGRLAYVPSVIITHSGGGAGRKGFRHILLFCRSALRFFLDHGWRF
jgi:GT2 family glycosyltransferase